MTALPWDYTERDDDASSAAEADRELLRLLSSADKLSSLGKARKVSVSLPEELTAAVQQRVGKGEFSHYIAIAVAQQLEQDLLHELAAELRVKHGLVAEEHLAEARAAWPDAE
ncbi:hypothetical protein LWC34_34795 [Kibdelosporangium philippinense]|uniref:CopG family transcriptional regulator n=1 Tax=Kibdelosporangium philippinense TaxID=211113 RepID=A0ABS8ZK77_9PSEU|nr:hypothetical protein [Kibdelosporangium philippinense]MCE7007952.1 hypothetical protein [Kibdelosporangium philippinense]